MLWHKAQGAGGLISGAATDPNFSDVSLLLHGDGTNGSTTFIDSSSNNFTVTASGNAQIDTTVVKYGTGSMQFDGSGDYLTVPYNTTEFDWWVEDYTLEAWIYPTTLTGWYSTNANLGSIPTLIGNKSATAVTNYWSFGLTSTGAIRLFYFNGVGQNTPSSTNTVSLNQWSHIAVVKDSNGYKYFVNGVGDSYNSISGTPRSNVPTGLTIGAYNSSYLNGYVDDLRITKGVARYTSNFTPPTAAFPDS